MKTFKKKTWRWLLVLASGLALVAASHPFDDPAPAAQVPAAMSYGDAAAPPAFTVYDVFKAPH